MLQQRRNKARWALLSLCATVVILGGAAWGCTNLATVNLSSAMGKPGDAITVTGTGFMANAAEMPMDGMDMDMSGPMMANMTVRLPVTVRWNGPEGPVLSTAVPDRSGTISVLFNVPDTQAGNYTVVAVQKNAQGYDVYGTPARAPLQVIGAGRAAGADAQGVAPAGSGQSASGGFIALTVGLGVLGLGLLAAGGVAATRTVRARREVPVRVERRPD
jgi:hypothetical protein